jgi:DHA2 family methylenomycin A resistance protein-like MFS transporter
MTEGDPTRTARVLPTLALCVGIFLVMFDVTAVSVALPAIGRGLHTAGLAGLQGVADAYTVTFAALLPAAGAAADRWGPKPVLGVGLAVFTLASAGCGLAPTLTWLVLARAIQGVAAATLLPASLALVRHAHVSAAARARAISGWAAAGGIAAAAGPVFGGVLTAALGWRSVFLINLPFGLLGLWLTKRHITSAGRPAAGRGLDLVGQLAATVALGCLVFAMIEAGHHSWRAPATLLAFGGGVLAAVGFVCAERWGRSPAVPLSVFRSRPLRAATGIGLLLNVGFYGQLFVVAFYFQRLRGWSALGTGFALLPQTATVVLGNAVSSRMMARFGVRPPMAAGLLCGAVGSLAWCLADARTSYPLLAPALAALGFGTALTMPAVVSTVVEAAPARHAGVAGGVLNASRQMGSAIGVALLGSLVSLGGFVSGMRLAALAACASFTLGALATLAIGRPAREEPTVGAAPPVARWDTAERH